MVSNQMGHLTGLVSTLDQTSNFVYNNGQSEISKHSVDMQQQELCYLHSSCNSRQDQDQMSASSTHFWNSLPRRHHPGDIELFWIHPRYNCLMDLNMVKIHKIMVVVMYCIPGL